MKTLGQINFEVCRGAVPDLWRWAEKDRWEAAAQAVRAAVIEECAGLCEHMATYTPNTPKDCAEAIRSLK